MSLMMQFNIFDNKPLRQVAPFKTQLLKWIGSKQRLAHEIISYFPQNIGRYFEPFLGSGAVLGTFAYHRSVGSDIFKPLADIWQTLRNDPNLLKQWYGERWRIYMSENKKQGYEMIRASYNSDPNAADLLFLCRSCYGGVVRFRNADGYMSTPCGIHQPISPEKFSRRTDEWHKRVKHTDFFHADYQEIMDMADEGDLIYCDPPYRHSQSILYGGQSFSLENLFNVIEKCRQRGVYVALSIDGTKKSGRQNCDLPIPDKLFRTELYVSCGRSMLKRFQMEGQSLQEEIVADRLLLTY